MQLFRRLSLLACLVSTPLMASFSVSPLTLEMQSTPESSETTGLVIRNAGDQLLSVEIKAFDFQMQPNGQEVELELGSNPRGCAQWLHISPSGLVDIGPGERQDVRVTINVPGEVEGTYWAKVAVIQASKPKPVRETHGDTTMQVFIKQRWEVRVHQSITGTGKLEGDIVNMLVDKFELEEPSTLALHFENTGNTLLHCVGKVEIRNEEGEKVKTLPLGHGGNFAVYPGSTRIISAPLPEDLDTGHYIALGIVDFGGESLVAGELEFDQP